LLLLLVHDVVGFSWADSNYMPWGSGADIAKRPRAIAARRIGETGKDLHEVWASQGKDQRKRRAPRLGVDQTSDNRRGQTIEPAPSRASSAGLSRFQTKKGRPAGQPFLLFTKAD